MDEFATEIGGEVYYHTTGGFMAMAEVTKGQLNPTVGSVYTIKSTSSNTLFFGDRTGSHYFFVMENTAATAAGNAWSGRYNPQFSQQVTTFMINPFARCYGLELFGTYELANGRLISEKDKRTAKQYAVDLIYRFPRERETFG